MAAAAATVDGPPEWWAVFVAPALEWDGYIVRYAFADRDPIEALIPGIYPTDEQVQQLAGLLLAHAPSGVQAEPVSEG